MIKRFFTLFLQFCLLVIFSTSINGQTSFKRTIDLGLNGIKGTAMAVTPNGDCLFTAQKNNILYIFKTDSAGILIFEKSISNTSTTNTLSISSLNNGDFLLTIAANYSLQPAISLLIDNLGNSIWLKTHSLSDSAFFNFAEELADGSTILAGQILESNGVDHDIMLMHLDSIGNYDWSKSITVTGDQVVNSLTATSDGGFVILDKNVSIARNIIRFSNSGNIIYAKKYGAGMNNGLRIEKFHETISGRNFLTATYFNQPNLQQMRVSLIIEIDSSGEMLSQKAFLNNLNHPLFSKSSWLYEDSAGNFKIFSSALPLNFNYNHPEDVIFHISMNNQLNAYNVQFQTFFASVTSISYMQQTSPTDFVQVLKIEDHYSSSPLVEFKTCFQKMSFAASSPCILQSPSTLLDTTVNTFQPVDYIINLNTYVGTTTQTIPPASFTSSLNNYACTPTSIDLLNENVNFSIYPNPASTNIFVISENVNLFGTEYSILNMLGDEIINGQMGSNSISISNLIPQQYILRIKIKNFFHYIRFEKN